jgi:hypothetical protein
MPSPTWLPNAPAAWIMKSLAMRDLDRIQEAFDVRFQS